MDWQSHISTDPNICHGQACVAGTRILRSWSTREWNRRSGGSHRCDPPSHLWSRRTHRCDAV